MSRRSISSWAWAAGLAAAATCGGCRRGEAPQVRTAPPAATAELATDAPLGAMAGAADGATPDPTPGAADGATPDPTPGAADGATPDVAADRSGDAPTPGRPLHLVAWGDEEGLGGRELPFPGSSAMKQPNPMMPLLRTRLDALDAAGDTPDLYLHAGDFVRFEHAPEPYLAWLGPRAARFYPTSGGDQECLEGTYARFVAALPHLAPKLRSAEHPAYATYAAGGAVFVLSLENPDGCGERLDAEQRRWALATLDAERARWTATGRRPFVVVLSHRPLWGREGALAASLVARRVDLVLSGDSHVLAWHAEEDTLFVVSGLMGDLVVGGCKHLKTYDRCVPPQDVVGWDATGPDRFDHFLDVRVEADSFTVEPRFLEPRAGRAPFPPIVRPRAR